MVLGGGAYWFTVPGPIEEVFECRVRVSVSVCGMSRKLASEELAEYLT